MYMYMLLISIIYYTGVEPSSSVQYETVTEEEIYLFTSDTSC